MKEFSSLRDIAESTFFIFKHSAACPISAGAHDAVRRAESAIEPPVYMVVVQRNRPLSDEITQRFGVRHESPQLLLIRDGSLVWSASHYAIRAKAIQEAARGA